MDVTSEFIAASRRYLQRSYRPKIERCLEALTDEQVWWRPNAQSNSVGNLILHLAGNIRQYVVSGAGGRPDIRMRDEEFAARDGISKEELLRLFADTLDEVDRVLEGLDAAALEKTITVQGADRNVFEAIYHAVEHFSMHTGQIIYITKQIADVDLGFYSFQQGAVRRHY